MASHEFNLVTTWHLRTPVKPVWDVLSHPEGWPRWWRAVKRVDVVSPGGPDGIGAVRAFTWRTALPYELSFKMTATKIEPMRLLEGEAKGELDGRGIWTLSETPDGTDVRYQWIVTLQKPWQRTMAPLLRPVFAFNHNVVLGWGEEDIKKVLGIAGT